MAGKNPFVNNSSLFLLSLSLFLHVASGNAQASDGMFSPDRTLEAITNFWQSAYGYSAGMVSGRAGYEAKLVAKAKPDECYFGVGEGNLYPFDFENQHCFPGKPKVNESYVFGLTSSGNKLWFGTAPNMGCLVYGKIAEQGVPGGLTPFDTELWTCEYGMGLFGQDCGVPEAFGDWRPPSVYVYDVDTQTLEKKAIEDPLIWETLGIRSAGSMDKLVFLVGPTVSGVGGPGETAGINMFAFHATTGRYLGSKHLPQYNNIRKWIAIDGVLYCGVLLNQSGLSADESAAVGAVLRWVGDENDPFRFEVVGRVDGDAVELAGHEGRLFVST